jgi:hypothetical protein
LFGEKAPKSGQRGGKDGCRKYATKMKNAQRNQSCRKYATRMKKDEEKCTGRKDKQLIISTDAIIIKKY